MSQSITLAAALSLSKAIDKKYGITIPISTILRFDDAADLDAVAEMLALNSVGDMKANAALLNRQVIASNLTGITDGNAVNVTYGPNGKRVNTDVGAPPAVVSAIVLVGTPTLLTVTFDLDIVSALADYKTGFSVKVAGAARTISSSARQVDTKVIVHTLASAVTAGQTVLRSYVNGTGDIKSTAGASLQTFTDAAVTAF